MMKGILYFSYPIKLQMEDWSAWKFPESVNLLIGNKEHLMEKPNSNKN